MGVSLFYFYFKWSSEVDRKCYDRSNCFHPHVEAYNSQTLALFRFPFSCVGEDSYWRRSIYFAKKEKKKKRKQKEPINQTRHLTNTARCLRGCSRKLFLRKRRQVTQGQLTEVTVVTKKGGRSLRSGTPLFREQGSEMAARCIASGLCSGQKQQK